MTQAATGAHVTERGEDEWRKCLPRSAEPASTPLSDRLTQTESLVWSVLQNHGGRQGAIKQRFLAAHCGIPVRELQDVLKSLTEGHLLPIASACSKPMGVFVIETAEEAKDYGAQLESRGISCFVRRKAMGTIERRLAIPSQDALPFAQERDRPLDSGALLSSAHCRLCRELLTGRQTLFCCRDHNDIWHGRKTA